MSKQTMLVVGIGDAGCRVLLELAQHWSQHPPLLAINTAAWGHGEIEGVTTLHIGAALIKGGTGAGGDPRIGRRAMEAELSTLRTHLENVTLVLIVTGLGGGTGTGVAPLVMAEARKCGALALALAMLPFEFEGRRRQDQAAHGLLALQEVADGVVCLPNQHLLNGDDLPIEQLFQAAHIRLSRCLQALWHMLERRGVINVDAADLCALVRAGGGRCIMTCATGTGTNKALQAVEALLAHPLLAQGAALANAQSLLLNIVGGPDLTLQEISSIMDKLTATDYLTATGVDCDPALEGQLWIMVLLVEKAGAPQHAAIPGGGATAAPAPRAGKSAARHSKPTQLNLFTAQAASRFAGVAPTIMSGENIDIPTFIRRGLPIQKARDIKS